MEVVKEILLEIDFNTIQTELLSRDKLPFEDLFEDNLRIAIPFVSKNMQDIKDILEEDYGMEADLDKKKVYYSVETKKGSQTKEMKLGKALAKIIREHKKKIMDFIKSNERAMKAFEGRKKQYQNPLFSFYKEYHDVADKEWFLKETGFTKEILEEIRDMKIMLECSEDFVQEGSGHTIIISRAPIDVLRMSDFKNLQSCHSKGGSYWRCAVAEAQDGGAVAFVVNKSDLKKIEDINQPEIFSDKERKIEGINPVSRIRVRNFVIEDFDDQGEYELAVPEDRVYGLELRGLEDEILQWARDHQISDFYNENGEVEVPDPEKIKIRGGAYSDTGGGLLLNNLFDLHGSDKKYKSHWTPEYENPQGALTIEEQYQEEADQYFDDLASNIENVHISFEIESDTEQGAFVWWNGQIYFSFPELDEPEYIKISNKELEKILESVNEASNRVVDLDKYIASVDEGEGYSFDITPDGGSIGHPDDFAGFLRYCQDIDKVYPAMEKAWNKAFFDLMKQRQKEAEQEAREDEEWAKKQDKAWEDKNF